MDPMNRVCAALAIAVLTLIAGCGDSADAPAGQAATSSDSDASGAAPTGDPTEQTYAVLAQPDLEAALLTVQDMPVGYSQEPPSEAGTKTFCDYEPPFTEEVHVSRDFIKGVGLSAELLHVGLRQFASAEQARAAFDALTKALSTCRSETYQGRELEYALMAAPKVGSESVGVRITDGGSAVMQNFVLVGPSMVVTGGGGLLQADADEIARLVEAQVHAYEAAAAQ